MHRDDGTLPAPTSAAEIGRAVAALVEDYTGRAPGHTRAIVEENLVLVMLADVLTRAERQLAVSGAGDAVRAMHARILDTMRADLVRLVEGVLGRRVAVAMFDSIVEPDLACQVFVLEPRG